jgi:tetratricopeptide (TPR) repeat protein
MDELEVVPVSAIPDRAQTQEGKTGGFQNIDQIQQLAKQTGAGIIITGTYYLTGLELQFTAKITDAHTGKLISSVSSEFVVSEDSKMDFVPYLDIIKNLRQRVMGVLAARSSPYMAGVLSLRPPTYEAYQEFYLGMEYFASNYDQSILHFQRANQLDPTFIFPLLILSTVYSNKGDYKQVQTVLDNINLQREELTEFDLFVLDHLMYDLQGNQRKALSTLRQAEKRFPDSSLIKDWIALSSLWLNRPQEALESSLKIDQEMMSKLTFPAASWFINRTIDAYHMLGDYENEFKTIQKAKEYFPNETWRFDEIRVLAALGKLDDIHRFVDESLAGLAMAGSPWDVLEEAVEELRVHGYMQEAQSIADRLKEWARKQMPSDPTERQFRLLADSFYLAQQWDEAYEIYKELTKIHPDSYYHIKYISKQGCIAARKGNREEARRISEDLGLLDSPYLFGRNTYQRACIASLLGEKQLAVDLLHQTMREGFLFDIDVIQQQDFLPLIDFPPFQEFIKPKG